MELHREAPNGLNAQRAWPPAPDRGKTILGKLKNTQLAESANTAPLMIRGAAIGKMNNFTSLE